MTDELITWNYNQLIEQCTIFSINEFKCIVICLHIEVIIFIGKYGASFNSAWIHNFTQDLKIFTPIDI